MSREREYARQVSNMLCNMGFNPNEFINELSRDHRTIQQSFTRLCLEWIKYCASDDYRHDERNRASHVKCKEIVETMSKDPAWDFLPYI